MGGPEDLGQQPGLWPDMPRHSQEPRSPQEPPESSRLNPGGPVVDLVSVPGLVGRAPGFVEALALIRKAAQSDSTVLLRVPGDGNEPAAIVFGAQLRILVAMADDGGVEIHRPRA